MKVKYNKDTQPSGKMGEAYKNEEKAPRRGVKADDADEFQNSSVDFSNMSVRKGQAYANQAKAPTGRGNRGPSQDDSGPISYWDKPVEKGDAYEEQCHWGEADNNQSPSQGFKLSGEASKYLGHFNQEKYLRQGHNDGQDMGSNYNQDKDATDKFVQGLTGNKKPSPTPKPSAPSKDDSGGGFKGFVKAISGQGYDD